MLFASVNGAELMDSLEECCREMLRAYSTLDVGLQSPHRGMVGDEAYEKWLDRNLAACGYRFIYDYELEDEGEEDPFGTDVKSRGDALRAALTGFVVG